MLFYIAPSVAKDLRSKNLDTFDFLCRILDARKRGMLLIHASKKTFKEIAEYFSSIGRHHEEALILTLAKKSREKRLMVRDLARFIYVTSLTNDISKIKKNFILISPKIINHTNILYPPIMLGENLTDCELYVNRIAKNFVHNLPTSMQSIKLSDRFIPGGGNSTNQVYQYHKDKLIDLCFCIVDSDRKCPTEGFGDTAKLVIAVDRDQQSGICKHLVIDAYSAENLLPITELERQFNKGKTEQQRDEFKQTISIRSKKSWPFLPLKKGITGKDLKDGKAHSLYWSQEIVSLGLTIPCCDSENCECTIIPAIHSKTLAEAVKAENSDWQKKLNYEENEWLQGEYLKISHEIRSWFCVGAEIRS